MYNGQMVEYVDATPSWEAVLPIYLAAYENGNRSALAELTRMARSLDEKNDQVEGLLAKINELETELELLKNAQE